MLVLFYCLLILLFTSLPSLAETKPSGFTTHLIHRDSPSSPFHNASATKHDLLRAAFRRSSSRMNHLLRLARPRRNTGIGTIISESDGEYLMKLSFGTPPVYEALLIADTGSDLIWLQCSPCTLCFAQGAPFFNPANSSGYRVYSCNSDPCKALPRYACVNENKTNPEDICGYYYSYGDDSFSVGFLSKDIIALNSFTRRVYTFPGSIFGCGHINGGISPSRASGLVGLGGGPLSLISQLGAKINNRFSYCLLPFSSSSNRTSKLSFGKEKIAGESGAVSTPLESRDPDKTFYYVTLQGVTVGGNTFRSTVNGSNEYIIVDSGTTLTYLETNLYNSVKATVKRMFSHLSPIKDPDVPDGLCYGTDPRRVKLPDMVFHFKGGANLLLKAANVFLTVENEFCLAILPGTELSIFGNVAQANFEVEFDIKNRLVSFAPKDCATV
ncbi:aspartic proteinase CDR1-like [Malania oleifera]|uniref:aspartic proteinase CDR1-like n=1 Tax=Malania oleifera TaxID=397392 RepID=UPI0025ADD223|nr:aspartic proteinase CDR1-like [Malania oleifera]